MLGIRPLINLAVGGSCSVFEVTHTIYKYASNRLSDKAPPSAIINYSLLIINCRIDDASRSIAHSFEWDIEMKNKEEVSADKPNVQSVRDLAARCF